jgi:hypothetical protein
VINVASQKNMVNRLYKDGETKKQKQEFYEEEKARREKEKCTFAPNSGLGPTKHIFVKINNNEVDSST